MTAKPIYLVTKYGPSKARSPASRYGKEYGRGGETWWRAGLVHGVFPGVGINFYFETEPQASRFSLWTLYDPSQIVKSATPEGHVYGVNDIWQSWFSYGTNFETGQPLRMQTWIVSLESPFLKQRIELRFPDEARARAYQGGQYSVQDLVGTLPASPIDVTQALAEFAAQARFAQQQIDLAAEQRRQAQENVTRTRLEQEAADIVVAAAKNAADAAAAKKAADDAAAAAAQALYISLANTRDITSMARAAGIDIDAPASSFADEYNRFYVPMAQVLADNVAKDFGAAAGETAKNQFLSKVTLANTSGQAAGTFSKTPGTPYVTAFRDYLLATGQHFGVPDPLASQAYYITNGGSRGQYDGALFQTGTFPVAGFWFGTYIRT